jgi:hypothetical protein
MVNTSKNDEQKIRVGDNGPCSDSASTLLPMLVGGLVLTIIGLIVVVLVV